MMYMTGYDVDPGTAHAFILRPHLFRRTKTLVGLTLYCNIYRIIISILLTSFTSRNAG